MSALPGVWIGRAAVKGAIFIIFYSVILRKKNLFLKAILKRNVCTTKIILLSQNYTYLGGSQCHQAENAAFPNHNCYHFSWCLKGNIKIQEDHGSKCSTRNDSQEQISVAVLKNSPRLWSFPLRNYRSSLWLIPKEHSALRKHKKQIADTAGPDFSACLSSSYFSEVEKSLQDHPEVPSPQPQIILGHLQQWGFQT